MNGSPLPTSGTAPRTELSLRPVAWGGTLLMAAVLAILAMAVWASYRQAVEESRQRAGFVARTLERSVTRTLEAVELALVNVAEGLGPAQGDAAPLRVRITDTLRFAPHIRQIAIVEGDRVIAASPAGAEGGRVDLARLDLDTPASVSGLSLGLRLGGRVDGRLLPLLDRPAAPPGPRGILGVAVPAGAVGVITAEPDKAMAVLAALNPEYFIGLFTDAGVGPRGAVALLRYDGQLLVGMGAAAPPLPDGLGTTRGEEIQVEGADALTTFRLSSRYPAVVAVTLAREDVFNAWLDANRMVLLVLGAVTLAVIGAVVLLAREIDRRVDLQRQVRLLYSAVEQASAVVVITDAQRRIEYVNPEFTRLFGYTPGDARGRNPNMLGSGLTPAETYAALWRTLESENSWRGEFINRTRDGAVRTMASTISRVSGGDGGVTHYIGVMEDVSERKAMEVERERMIAALSRSNAEMSRLAEVMSHHFQEPVRRLATFATRLRQSADTLVNDPDSRIALDFIDSESRRLRALVNDVQVYLAADVIRPGAMTVEAEAARALVADEASRLAPRLEALGGRFDIGPLPAVPLDPARLRQLLHQVLKNAAEHAGADGRAPVVRVSGTALADGVRLRVEDNGPGVPAAYRQRVFRLFEKLKASGAGTGIGLAIARRIVESRGGRIWIEDGPDGGAALVIELPLEPDHAPS
ncbi:ATP-binding protein [Novispirillum sp. DQ9]|uniref:sensor histidine kinase n=1 Tax=Novispirillum sp. DQ9 TaxID=3398612 RepID=UPI003C7E57C5